MKELFRRFGTLCLLLMLAMVSRADGFKDFSVIVNNQDGTLLTAEEQVQGTDVYFGVAVADDGTVSRVAADDASAVATVYGKYHSEHGCTRLRVEVPNATNVKITVGQCTYSTSAISVRNSQGIEVTHKTASNPGCWKNDRNNVDFLYYMGEATTLTITGMAYCPYVAVSQLTEDEIAALNASYILTYYNTDGSVLGTQEVKGQEPIGEFKYGVNDVTVESGFAFRGWFAETSGGKKYKTEDKVEADMSLYAVATAIEVADNKSTYVYNLADANFDPADHECIEIVGSKAYWHDSSHGWAFYNDEQINLKVGGDATITIVNCQYGNGTNIAVKNAVGETIGSLPAKSDADGGVATFEYKGEATTLSLCMESSGEMYIHSVSIANHSDGGGQHELATLDNEPATATFAFNAGTEGQKADFGEAADYFVTSKVTYGSNLFIKGLGSIGNGQTQFEPLTQQNEGENETAADESNAIRFIIQPNYGLTFTPKRVSLKATRFGTDNGLLDFSWENPDKTTVSLAIGEKPNRNNNNPNVSEYAYDIVGATPSEGKCALLINLYHLQGAKQIGFSDIVIEGTLSGTEKEVPVLASLTINGEEYTAEEIFDDAYEAEMELSKKVPMVGETNPVTATAKKGDVGIIGYVGDDTKCVVTIPMTQGETTLEYVLTLVQKPDYKLTYIDTDKKTVLGEFTREKDEAIGAFDIDYATATADEGMKVRGWFLKTAGGEKYTAETIVTSDINLYAVATEIEEPSTHKKYFFDLTNKLFDPADHEAFNPTGGYYWHDTQHGYAFKDGDKVDLLVGPKATVSVTLCRYGSGVNDIVITENGKEIGSIPGVNTESVDGEIVAFLYEGQGGTITLNMSCASEMYIHAIKIVNTAETNYESQGNWYFVKAGDASSLIDVLDVVNGINSAKDAERSFIFLPDGIYDLNETVKTAISGHNISIIGQSMDNTIIVTAPDKSIEGLGSADMFQSSGTNLYMQDLTLENALDYYNAGSAGRAAVIQDSGNRTIFKNVRMLSCQDTYYSSNDNMQSYFEDCDVHGTVDFICGGGDVRFQNTTLSLEPRQLDGKGSRTIVAPRGTVKFGYVFDNCKVVDLAEGNGTWNFGRTWNNDPMTVYLNTTLDENAQKTLIASRWIEKGMNSKDPVVFGEYNTMDINGNNITPESNIIKSHGGEFQTILSAEQAANYSYKMMFSENLEKAWDPAVLTLQVEAPINLELNGNTLSWAANDNAIAWAVFKDGVFAGLSTDATYTVDDTSAQYSVRAANEMGGLGETASTPAIIKISKAGYATFYDSQNSYALPKALKAYVVTEATTEALTYVELESVIPAGTAVMVESVTKAEGEYTLEPIKSDATYTGTNLLYGSDIDTYTYATDGGQFLFYKLAFGHSGTNKSNVFGWYWGANDGAAFEIEGHRAWLAIPQETASTRGYLFGSGDPTGISMTDADVQNEGDVYNLQGQRVTTPTKGLYIRNNKKVIIK